MELSLWHVPVLFLLWFVYKVIENMPLHNHGEEERCSDDEMAPIQPYLYPSLLTQYPGCQ